LGCYVPLEYYASVSVEVAPMNMAIRALIASTLFLLISCGVSNSTPSSTDAGFQLFDSGRPAVVRSTEEKWWELGDSITYGIGTTPPTGYRLPIYEWVSERHCPVSFVGTSSTGSWPLPFHDGHPGFTIENLTVEVRGVYGSHVKHADLIFLMIGTNDMGILKDVPYDGPTVIAHYAGLLDQIATVDSKTTILVTTIPPMDSATYPSPASNVLDFNRRLRPAWDDFDARHSTKLLRADEYTALAPWSLARFVNVHPNAVGYGLMAQEEERVLEASGHCN
jgi:hypothetical protein